MSHRIEAKQARREARLRAEAERQEAERRQQRVRRGTYGVVGAVAAALIAFAVFGGGSAGPPATGAETGPEVGQKAPEFELTDVVSGKSVSSESLGGKRTMLFFSEGVNCQACMFQAADLEKAGVLERDGIELVSVTNDQPADLAEAAGQYGISTPLLADPGTEMTARYGMLGHGGMGHPDVAGHAFMLVDEDGKVLWHRAYQEMYVKPAQLLSDMKAEMAA